MANERKIALLGQPNSGKSTVFNTLTGAHQHVGNWPGKTVEKVEGEFTRNGVKYLVADLPGTYSLSANSDEEIVTRDYIASGGAELTCILADASQLEWVTALTDAHVDFVTSVAGAYTSAAREMLK